MSHWPQCIYCVSKIPQELNISHCLNVTDEAVEVLFKHCPRLSILVFHGCPRLTSHSYDVASTHAGLKQSYIKSVLFCVVCALHVHVLYGDSKIFYST